MRVPFFCEQEGPRVKTRGTGAHGDKHRGHGGMKAKKGKGADTKKPRGTAGLYGNRNNG